MTTQKSVTRSVTAANQFSAGAVFHGDFNLSISGSFNGIITVQRSFDGGLTWLDVETFTSAVERIGHETETNVQYRVGAKSGEFTSGTAECRLSQ